MVQKIRAALTLKILRRQEVEFRTGLSRSTIYARVKNGTFPAPVALGSPYAVGWIESEVEEWLRHQIEQRPLGEQALQAAGQA